MGVVRMLVGKDHNVNGKPGRRRRRKRNVGMSEEKER